MARIRLQMTVMLLAAPVGCAGGSWLYFGSTPQAPEVIRPPLDISMEVDEMRVWGAWDVQAGYVQSGTGAIEIRCFRQASLCVEAEANLLQHTEGQDLTAEVRLYRITSWSDNGVEAEQLTTDADCVQGTLQINPGEQGARRSWKSFGECEAEPGYAILVGDPL